LKCVSKLLVLAFEIAIEKLKGYEFPGIDDILAVLIQT